MTNPEGRGQGAFQEQIGAQVDLIHRALEGAADPVQAQLVLAGLANIILDLDQRLRTAEHAAMTHPLTGLPNRRALERERFMSARRGTATEERPLRRAEDLASLYASCVACIYVDLDHFKEINDTYGHDQGDRMLRYTAIGLECAIRASDELYHISGDEFVLFLRVMSEEHGWDLTAEIYQRLKDQYTAMRYGNMKDILPPDLADITPVDYITLDRVDATFGVQVKPGPYVDRVGMLEYAERAMRAAKIGSRDR